MYFESSLRAGRRIVEKATGAGRGRGWNHTEQCPHTPAAEEARLEHDGPYTEWPRRKASHAIITYFTKTCGLVDSAPCIHIS